MNIVYILAPIALSLSLCMVFAFLWCARNGQCDDLETPAFRMLSEEDSKRGKR